MHIASLRCPPTSRNQSAMQTDETIASPEASPSSPSIRLNALTMMITHTSNMPNVRMGGTIHPKIIMECGT